LSKGKIFKRTWLALRIGEVILLCSAKMRNWIKLRVCQMCLACCINWRIPCKEANRLVWQNQTFSNVGGFVELWLSYLKGAGGEDIFPILTGRFV
jgi:hypothetical protein